MFWRAALSKGRMAGIRALAGDTTALRITIRTIFIYTHMQEESAKAVWLLKVIIIYNWVKLVLPLGSRHHLGHGGHKVYVCDGNRINIKNKFLWWGVDLWIAAPKCTQCCFWTHCLDVCSAITYQGETHRLFVMTTKTVNNFESVVFILANFEQCLACINNHNNFSSEKNPL